MNKRNIKAFDKIEDFENFKIRKKWRRRTFKVVESHEMMYDFLLKNENRFGCGVICKTPLVDSRIEDENEKVHGRC